MRAACLSHPRTNRGIVAHEHCATSRPSTGFVATLAWIPGAAGKLTSCLLLHVDDNRDDLTLLRDAYREHGAGVRIESSPSATAAMSFLAREVPFAETTLPDLILIDVYMPLIGGIQLLCILAETPTWAAIPTVMFAASGRSRERDECRELGAAGFILKPTDWQGYAAFAKSLAREIRNGRLKLVHNDTGASNG